MADMPSELSPGDVYRESDTSTFAFTTTEELPDLDEIIGQPRAVSSVEFGMGVGHDGYNIFAVGPTGTGKSSMIYQFLTEQAASLPVPDDWVYVHNFDEPSRPRVIRMRSGQGQEFRKYMEGLVEDLKVAITQIFDSEDYARQRQELIGEFQERVKGQYEALNQKAEEQGFLILASPSGVVVTPKMPDGQPMPTEASRGCPRSSRRASTRAWAA
jgi:hypothetical protein